jgi:hypothetical protein
MNCFEHRGSDAVALCRACGKGLCRECIESGPAGVSCKGSCLERLSLVEAEGTKDTQSRTATRRGWKVTAAFAFLPGLLMALSATTGAESWPVVAWGASVLFTIAGISYYNSRLFPRS